jgi:ParB-like chromosome segregation protein Spo0J
MTINEDRRKIADIHIGKRHRKEIGELGPLAESISKQGLLQPIGVTAANELVFGERRLIACRDILGWTDISVRVVNVTSIADGEHDENQLRKQFTVSERAAIFRTIERKSRGNPHFSNSADRQNSEQAAKRAGFSSTRQAYKAQYVAEHAIPEVAAALDRGEISTSAAEQIARAPETEQAALLAEAPHWRGKKTKEKEEGRRHQEAVRKIRSSRMRRTPIPWTARQAATVLFRSWPRDLIRELAAELSRRLEGDAGTGGRARGPTLDPVLPLRPKR